MSEIQTLPPHKNSVTIYNIIIVVFALVIFTLLMSFNAFSPTDFSKKMSNPPSPEKSAGVAMKQLTSSASHDGHDKETKKTGH